MTFLLHFLDSFHPRTKKERKPKLPSPSPKLPMSPCCRRNISAGFSKNVWALLSSNIRMKSGCPASMMTSLTRMIRSHIFWNVMALQTTNCSAACSANASDARRRSCAMEVFLRHNMLKKHTRIFASGIGQIFVLDLQ